MEERITITQITRMFGVSTRTMRYYEQMGLVRSVRTEDYAYRMYDAEAVAKLQQILLLRKLRLPLKQISDLLRDPSCAKAVAVFSENIYSLDAEIASLQTVRDILQRFSEHLRANMGASLKVALLDDDAVYSMLNPLPAARTNFKEETKMEELNRANERLDKLTDRDVRIVYLPPADVAAYGYVGDEPEAQVNAVIDKFVRESDLIRKKPDLRHYGFNAPNPVDETNFHGYEMWVTIPDGMDVPAPLVKKRFEGGVYAARMIPFGMFEEWGRLFEWVQASDAWAYRGTWDPSNMCGCLEEHLNYVSHVNLGNTEPDNMQLDLLIPVKEK